MLNNIFLNALVKAILDDKWLTITIKHLNSEETDTSGVCQPIAMSTQTRIDATVTSRTKVRYEWMEDVDLDPPDPCRSNASPALQETSRKSLITWKRPQEEELHLTSSSVETGKHEERSSKRRRRAR